MPRATKCSRPISGAEALSAVAAHRPGAVILDLGLPDMEGSEVTRRLREWSPVPIIILSVRGQETEKIAALDAGADDYLTKPFGLGELLARMRRRRCGGPAQTEPPCSSTGELRGDLGRRMVTVAGNEVAAHARRSMTCCGSLVHHAGQVLTHHQTPPAGVGRRLRAGGPPPAGECQQPATEDRA